MCIAGQMMEMSRKFNPLTKKIEQDYGIRPKSGLQLLGLQKESGNKFFQEGGGGFQKETTQASPGRYISPSIAARKASGG